MIHPRLDDLNRKILTKPHTLVLFQSFPGNYYGSSFQRHGPRSGPRACLIRGEPASSEPNSSFNKEANPDGSELLHMSYDQITTEVMFLFRANAQCQPFSKLPCKRRGHTKGNGLPLPDSVDDKDAMEASPSR